MAKPSCLAFALCFFFGLLHLSSCSVHRYSQQPFLQSGNAFLFPGGSEGMYASASHDRASGIADGRSFIRFDSIKFRRTNDSASRHSGYASSTGLVQAIIFDASDRSKIGSSLYGNDICCTPDVAKIEGCKLGEVIIRPSTDDAKWPMDLRVQFEGDSTEAIMVSERVDISKTGMYNLYFVFCDPQLKGLVIDGTTVWKNPTGYLPGSMVPLVTFYGVMILAYLVLGLAWFSKCVRYWKGLLNLHNQLAAIIALGMFEVGLWYFEYANFNATGHRPMGITVWAVTVGTLKKTLSRLLILVVSMGYGVVRPILGGFTPKVILLGVTYFICAEALDIVENVGTINDLSGSARLFLVLPVAILDGVFIIWIFASLSKILETLQARRMVAKLELYRRFTITLTVSVMVAVAWIGHELYFKATDRLNEAWENAWIISSFWNILTFALLCVMCFLWAPSEDCTRYAYSDEAGENFDDENIIPLKSNVTIESEKKSLKLYD